MFFVSHRRFSACLYFTWIAVIAPQHATAETKIWPCATWDLVASPEEVGWSSSSLEAAQAYAGTLFTDSVVIVHQGKIVFSWGDIHRKLPCHSMRKSLMSLMVGMGVNSGKLDTHSTLAQLGIDDKQSLSPPELEATMMDLLKSRSGVYHPSALEPQGMKDHRPERGSHSAGEFWFYNNWDFNALLTIFEQETSEDFYESFEANFARPLEMETFTASDGHLIFEDASIHPGYVFNMTAIDLARVGLLMARGGRWRDRQIVSADWIRESTTPYSDTGIKGWYGYMWYVTKPGEWKLFAANVGERAWGASGWGGHRMVILPDSDLVVVHRVNTTIPISSRIVRDPEFGQLLTRILAARPKRRRTRSEEAR